jgi:hypothetical protein
MESTGSLSRPLIVAALIVNGTAAATMALWHPDRFVLHQLEGLIPIALLFTGLGFLAAAFIRGKVRTVGFVVRPGVGFIAPAERRVGYALIMFITLGAVTVGQDFLYPRTPGTTDAERSVGRLLTSFGIASSALLAVAVCLYVGMALSGRPRLELTVDGVRLRGIWRGAAHWDELVPSRQADQDSVTLPLNRPGRSVKLSLLLVRVHALFVADAVRYYIEHPEHRAAIGTQAEYDNLLQSLGVSTSPS